MVTIVQNSGTTGVFFDEQITSTTPDDLISAQVDPSQPQVKGLSTVTGPLVSDQHMSVRAIGFDDEQFNLSDTSHLMRFLTALIAGSGIGGLRRQQIISRMSFALAGTNFVELDGFWGALFSIPRAPEEVLPTGATGSPIDPSIDVADSITWDTAAARDGRYRSRIEQLAKGFALGGTYEGLRLAAKALLGTDVDILEGWLWADFATDGSVGFTGNTWQAVELQYGTWANLNGQSWGVISLGTEVTLQSPVGNRGEVMVTPGRPISEAERFQLHNVLNKLVPAGVMVTISLTPFTAEVAVPCRSVSSDSVDWDVVSVTSQQQNVNPDGHDLYPESTTVESARPAFGRYTGERFSYNGRVAEVSAYALDDQGLNLPGVDYQTVTYSDGTSHDYRPGDALVDFATLALARAGSEGVLTTFPYIEGRIK